MKKTTFILSLILISILTTFIYSCKKKTVATCDGTASTYNSNIKTILNNACTNNSCHPTYTSYANIKSILTNGNFKKEVLTNKSMPKGTSLSSDELSKI